MSSIKEVVVAIAVAAVAVERDDDDDEMPVNEITLKQSGIRFHVGNFHLLMSMMYDVCCLYRLRYYHLSTVWNSEDVTPSLVIDSYSPSIALPIALAVSHRIISPRLCGGDNPPPDAQAVDHRVEESF